ncbi:hypothetical protein KCK33_004501 [Salmonella enterica]|nr:hypothetical protein [Salmonella enterica]EGA0602501.1 hypothetical protein [Salmonella enterica]EHD2148099.1 hypothetical protein [Salmonella enterica]EHK2354321.1 hypothetical protein [Salmonella enterica]
MSRDETLADNNTDRTKCVPCTGRAFVTVSRAGLVTGDEVIMRLDEGYQLNAAENWKAQLAVTVKYL